MNPLLTVIPFHSGDVKLVIQLLNWLKVLHPEGIQNRHVLLACDYTDEKETLPLAKSIFAGARKMTVDVPKDRQGWPKAPNYMFESVARQVHETTKLNFLWLEPDSVPMVQSWLCDLEVEYNLSPRKFMGALISGVTTAGASAKHMSGVGIYPNDCIEVLAKTKGDIAKLDGAFDLELGPKILPRFQETDLIQHHWGRPSVTFVEKKALTSDANVVPLSLIKPETVLFHGVKDSSLVDLLAPKIGTPRPMPTVAISTAPTPATDESAPFPATLLETTIPSTPLPVIPAPAATPPPAPPAARPQSRLAALFTK